MHQADTKTITSSLAAATSFALGVAAALPELGSAGLFRRTRSLTAKLAARAPSRGRFNDGYDFVADLTAQVRT